MSARRWREILTQADGLRATLADAQDAVEAGWVSTQRAEAERDALAERLDAVTAELSEQRARVARAEAERSELAAELERERDRRAQQSIRLDELRWAELAQARAERDGRPPRTDVAWVRRRLVGDGLDTSTASVCEHPDGGVAVVGFLRIVAGFTTHQEMASLARGYYAPAVDTLLGAGARVTVRSGGADYPLAHLQVEVPGNRLYVTTDQLELAGTEGRDV